MTETWTGAPGFPRYLVSSLGKIRNRLTGKLLFGERDRDGYRLVNLVDPDGRKVKRRVHRLTCEAFHGAGPEGREVAHLNGKPYDNRAENLCWATRSENNLQKALHGTRQAGEQHPGARLTEANVTVIRSRLAEGHSERSIAADYGVGHALIHKIKHGKRWAAPPKDAPK